MTPDDLSKILLKRLSQNAPGIEDNELKDCILGAEWKPWYSRISDYLKMGWHLFRGQYIWDGESTFKKLSGQTPFHKIGYSKLGSELVSNTYPQPSSVRPHKIDVMVATCDVDNHRSLVIANDLPENLKYFKDSSDYKFIYRDNKKDGLAWHAAYATAALPCFQRF